MTQEEKDLLIKDLCARLPYGVVVEHCSGIRGTLHDLFVHWCYDENDVMHDREAFTSTFFGDDDCDISKFKPYLFPLSSMTEAIKDEIYQETGLYDIFENDQIHIEVGTNFADVFKLFNILNKYNLDYNGLIPLGLANDATGLNIY